MARKKQTAASEVIKVETHMFELQQLAQADTVFVIGLGREGLSSTQFLLEQFADKTIILIDDKHRQQLSDEWLSLLEDKSGISFFSSTEWLQQAEDTSTSDMDELTTVAIKSPGIPPTHPVIRWFSQLEVPIISNTGLFFNLVEQVNNQLADRYPASKEPLLQVIGITGTKGKSTTTACIYHVLTQMQQQCLVGGNIGHAPLLLWSEYLTKIDSRSFQEKNPTYLVVELSAHQLQDLSYSPHISIVQNVTPEHLDYYHNFSQYWQAKSNICAYQSEDDVVIYNADYQIPTQIAAKGNAQILSFSSIPSSSLNTTGFSFNDTTIFKNRESLLELSQLRIPGKHNLENVIPSLIVAELIGLSAKEAAKAVQLFTGLPHRLQLVGQYKGVRFFNDSLSTTPVATIAALNCFEDEKIILLAGGHERNLDYTQLANAILEKNVPVVILFPPTGQRIAEAFKHTRAEQPRPALHFVSTMQEAITIVKEYAHPDDVVLLSPASPSFGSFRDYADRGEQFAAEAERQFA